MRLLLLILIPLFFTSCMEPLTDDEIGNEYTVQAYLTAGDTVSDILVRKILRYVDYHQWKEDGVTKHSEVVEDAVITLQTGDSIIPLNFNIYKESYGSPHRVIPGATYNLRVTVKDEQKGEISFTSSTTVPTLETDLALSSDTMILDTGAIRNDYWGIIENPANYDHLKLTSSKKNTYRLLEFSGMDTLIFRVDEGGSASMGHKQIPLTNNPRIISPIDLGFYGGYRKQYRLVVRQVQEEYVDLYREQEKDKFYWKVIPIDLYAQGISNIEGANGIFSGTATDTLWFNAKIK